MSHGRRATDLIVKDGPSRHKYMPDLYYDHGGYFKVVLSLILIHVGLALDALRPETRETPIFAVLKAGVCGHLGYVSALHVLVGVLLILGLYWSGKFFLLRVGCAISFLMFNVIAAAFTSAALDNSLSLYAAMASVTLSLSSLAAFKEPPIQIARRP